MRASRLSSTLALLGFLLACGADEKPRADTEMPGRMSGISPRNVRLPQVPPKPDSPVPVVTSVEGECLPLTCATAAAEFGIECGTLSDGCDGTLECGDPCEQPQTCGGGGAPNLCGCPDGDLDGHCDSQDNCVDFPNPSQNDVDADGVGDGCDRCPLDADNDGDSDNRCANVDNCPGTYNPEQIDGDSDGQGDACDAFTCPMVLDFEVDDDGVPILAGTALTTQFAARGVTSLSCENNRGPDVCLAFDSGNPTGGDFDLFSPIDGMIAIIAENVTDADGDGLVDAPDDEARGGAFVLELAQPSLIGALGIRDIDLDEPDAFGLYCSTEVGVVNVPIPALGNNSYQEVPVDLPGVTSVRIELPSSGGLVSLTYCPACEPTTCEAEGKNCESIPDGCGGTLFCGDCSSGLFCGGGGVPNVCGCEDGDGDSICDDVDNCPQVFNADQTDTDSDSAGNACDSDDDNDGIEDASDLDPQDPTVCVDMDMDLCDDCTRGADGFGPLPDAMKANDGPDQDGDGLCDAGDVCVSDAQNDIDGDGFCADVDNCPEIANPEQTDTDGDGMGDACEECMGDPADDDFDTVCNAEDNCPSISNLSQADHDDDGMGDICDADADNDGVPKEQDCDDLNAMVFPGAEEFCDTFDSDCDGSYVDSCVFMDLNSDGIDDRAAMVLPLAPLAVPPQASASGLTLKARSSVTQVAQQQAAESEDDDFDEDGRDNGSEIFIPFGPQPLDADGDGVASPAEVIANPEAIRDDDEDGFPQVVESAFEDSDGDGVPDDQDPAGDLMPDTPLWLVDVELEATFTSIHIAGQDVDVLVTTLPDDSRLNPLAPLPQLFLQGSAMLNARFLLLHNSTFSAAVGTTDETPLLRASRERAAASDIGVAPSWYGLQIANEFGTGGTYTDLEVSTCFITGPVEYRIVEGAFPVQEWTLEPSCTEVSVPTTPLPMQEPGGFSGFLFSKRFGGKDRFSLGFLNALQDGTPDTLDIIPIQYTTVEQHSCILASPDRPCPPDFVDSGTSAVPFDFAFREVRNDELVNITDSFGEIIGPAFEVDADLLRGSEPFVFPPEDQDPLTFLATGVTNASAAASAFSTYGVRLRFRPIVAGVASSLEGAPLEAFVGRPTGDPRVAGQDGVNQFRFRPGTSEDVLAIPVRATRSDQPLSADTQNWGLDNLRWTISSIGDSHEQDAAGEPLPGALTGFRWCADPDVASTEGPRGAISCFPLQVEGDHRVGVGFDPVATFGGLPLRNTDFGPKLISLAVGNKPLVGKSPVLRIETFYPPKGTNHPSAPLLVRTDPLDVDQADPVPNWLFYFAQNSCMVTDPRAVGALPVTFASLERAAARETRDRQNPHNAYTTRGEEGGRAWMVYVSDGLEAHVVGLEGARQRVIPYATFEGPQHDAGKGLFPPIVNGVLPADGGGDGLTGLAVFLYVWYHEAEHWRFLTEAYDTGQVDARLPRDTNGMLLTTPAGLPVGAQDGLCERSLPQDQEFPLGDCLNDDIEQTVNASQGAEPFMPCEEVRELSGGGFGILPTERNTDSDTGLEINPDGTSRQIDLRDIEDIAYYLQRQVYNPATLCNEDWTWRGEQWGGASGANCDSALADEPNLCGVESPIYNIEACPAP